MTTSFEGIFGEQTEFPIGNRDADINSALEEMKKEGRLEAGVHSPEGVAGRVIELIAEKYNVDAWSGLQNPTTETERKEADRANAFYSVYDPEYITQKAEAFLSS